MLTALRSSAPVEGAALRRLDVYAPSGGRQISMLFSCRSDRFDRWQPQFRDRLATVRFARPAQGEPTLGDRLWTPLIAGALVTILLLALYKHTHRR